jgi:hypothetical protein
MSGCFSNCLQSLPIRAAGFRTTLYTRQGLIVITTGCPGILAFFEYFHETILAFAALSQ